MSEIPETKANFLRNEIDCSDCNIKKQLKRKEQECKELNNTITNLENTKEELLTKIDQLQADNEKLDIENKRLVAEVVNPVFDSFEELDQLKQALQEIKGILEQYLDADKRIDKEADVDVYLMAMQKWINKCEVLNGNQ